MEHFIGELVGGLLEFLFGIPKTTSDHLPDDLEYVSSFSVKYFVTGIRLAIFAVLSVAIGVAVCVLAYLGGGPGFALLFAVPAVILLSIFIFQCSFKCKVTDESLTESYLFFFHKIYHWRDVICVRIIEADKETSVTIALYQREGKLITSYNTPMVNVWLIVKMAEHHGIEIKKEKNLTYKEMKQL